MNSENIKAVAIVKYLGIILDKSLNMHDCKDRLLWNGSVVFRLIYFLLEAVNTGKSLNK